MSLHIQNRQKIVLPALAEELMGPRKQGKDLDISRSVSFDDNAAAAGPWSEKGTGEEILTRDKPTKRYGVAVLYPYATTLDEDGNKNEEEAQIEPPDMNIAESLSDEVKEELRDLSRKTDHNDELPDPDDFEITPTNAYRPSSIGVSFLARFPPEAELTVRTVGARYAEFPVTVRGKKLNWWVRRPYSLDATWASEEICGAGIVTKSVSRKLDDGFNMSVEIHSRPYGDIRTRLITVTLVNRTESGKAIDANCLFQASFSAFLSEKDGASLLPYPEEGGQDKDAEEASIALLYRHTPTYAIGHGCSADWEIGTQTILATCLPVFEAAPITPDVTRSDGSALEVPMNLLAGLVGEDDGLNALNEVVSLYENWVESLKAQVSSLDARYASAALTHIEKCGQCAQRMRGGLSLLKRDKQIADAFQLANYAMLLQQSRAKREARSYQFDEKAKRIFFSEPFPAVSIDPPPGKGMWRAFQIAFLLLSLQSAADGNAPDRETVELIWFPTGGGKTEAYLGLSAFSMFLRRLRNPQDAGVNVLMRYTLRLLTAQQFQRASALIMAMEYIRKSDEKKFGDRHFSIGIWLGGSTTPNRRSEAIEILRGLTKKERDVTNKFVLSRCPWCAAQMGPVKNTGSVKCPGYERVGPTVGFKCPDSACDFHSKLPIYVIDEDIYEERPTLVIGTVDKFAMLAWRPEARAIFGIDPNGQRLYSPPGLIIQDELHLISGPLGSMVGLYEVVIEELCTDRRDGNVVKPKIISSTATIRRYEDQIRSLYGREESALFPPPGLSAGDSFFARHHIGEDGKPLPGRQYVGVYAPGLGSMQTVQVRTFSSLLQAPFGLPHAEEQDPWWTLLCFFNSLRELGTTLSLLQSDIPDYLGTLRSRLGLTYKELRRIRPPLELTGRLRGDEVQAVIDLLDVKTTGKNRPVDVCLASNIIEVGVDIDRLSLMCVVGQPKTTSQYIQVTGRVGRKADRPGLVVTIYGASKPRDRSHFERFRSYHECLYAQVEPTSITPFSPPALDRALHAVMTAFVRQLGDSSMAASPSPFPKDMVSELYSLLIERVRKIDPDEEENFKLVFEKRAREWERWERVLWRRDSASENVPQLLEAGAYATLSDKKVSWATPMSMRNVDAECQIEITQNYLDEGQGNV
jgi:hypothetical protein